MNVTYPETFPKYEPQNKCLIRTHNHLFEYSINIKYLNKIYKRLSIYLVFFQLQLLKHEDDILKPATTTSTKSWKFRSPKLGDECDGWPK